MVATIPNTKKEWKQDNSSDLGGNIHITKNITFDDSGYARLSYSSRSAMDESVDTDFNNPAVILFSDDYGYFVETWEEAFSVNTDILSVTPTQIATVGVPTGSIQSDSVWFGGLMAVSQDTDLKYYSPTPNTWTDTNISLTNAGQHQLVHFISQNALAVVNVNTIQLYSSPLSATPTLIQTLTIPADFRITSVVYYNQNLYIGTQHIYGGHAYLYIWNGEGTSTGQCYEADSNIIFSLTVYDNGIAMITGNGGIQKFAGGGFVFLGAFPIYYTEQALTDETNIGMYKNIMKANGKLLYILFTNRENNANRLIDQPDGVWCYDPAVGLHHRYSLSNALVSVQSSSTVNTSTNQITVTSAPVTGTEVVYKEVFGLTPLVNGTKYFVIKVDSTHIKLATTLANAVAGIEIDLLVSSGSNTYSFFPNIDFGQYFINRAMALTVIERPVSNPLYGTDILWGAEVIRRDSSGDYGTLGTVSNGVEARGYLITPKIFSENITDTFNDFVLKFSPFVSELDKIIIKYRTYDDMRKFINISSGWSISWAGVNSFTTTQSDWSSAKTAFDAGEKWEVEIMRGAGAGILAHISNITLAGSIYTVTLDENFDNYTSGDIGIAVFRNWIKQKVISPTDTEAQQFFYKEQWGKKGKFIQVKVELRGIRVRLEEIMIDNKYLLPAKKSA